jgi:hypothetical protein
MGRFVLLKGRNRPLSFVPRSVMVVLFLALVAQLLFHGTQPQPVARASGLPQPARGELLTVMSLGESTTLSRVLMLWLQAFDYQSGVSLSFMDLDPDRLTGWLERILALDPRSHYPLVAASQMYADIPRPQTQRTVSEFVYRSFLKDPNHRWRWLGHVAIIAKHRLKDLPLALKYSQALAQHARGSQVPTWVRQMPFTILEDMGELAQARIYIGGLLSSGEVKTPEEIHLLRERLEALEKKMSKSPQ